jgi:acetate kinase
MVWLHDISHAYCTGRAAELLKRHIAQLNLAVWHLGGGGSTTAVRHATAIATTSGCPANLFSNPPATAG